MRCFRKVIATIVSLGIATGATLPAKANAMTRVVGARSFPGLGRAEVAGVPQHMLPAYDFGRRPALARVNATVTLRYNHQAELDGLVRAQSDWRSPLYHHYLTSAQFRAYFAPTVEQQATVIGALRTAGLSVTRSYPNRTLLDVAGTSAAAERFFGTEIHSLSQGRYGERFMNVSPVTVPASLASLVRSVSLSNVIFARTGPRKTANRAASQRARYAAGTSTAGRNSSALERFRVPANVLHRRTRADSPNVVADPGFESGGFGSGWSQCEIAGSTPLATITSARAHSGSYSSRSGSTTATTGEQYRFAGVCQLVRIPASGVLSAYLYQLSNEPNTKFASQDVFLLDPSGSIAAVLAESVADYHGWVQKSWDLTPYAGRDLYLYFGVHGNGARNRFTVQYVDDVSLSAAQPEPTPTPTVAPTATPTVAPTATPTVAPTATPTVAPTATPTVAPTATPTVAPTATPTVAPTATPTVAPTATPTVAPTATPTVAPTATPTVAPTATPTAAPTATPTAAPTAPANRCSAAPDNGPLTDAYGGHLATSIADAFDFPVQHGCNGTGETVAVEISSPVLQKDVNAYLAAAGITQTGTIVNVPVNGGGTNNSSSDDTIEATLDVETIIGLAPGINVRVYEFPDLSNGNIENAYNQTVSDDLVSVTNSSFGECETADASFGTTTNSIAEQGAAEGMTFVASSGDSGSDGCATGNNPPEVSVPSADPYFVGVGAVDFTQNSAGTLTSLTAAVDGEFESGGGVSTVFPLPGYQAGVPNVIASGRNVPDVSLPGVDVSIYVGGKLYVADGTSWSSPQFVALLGEANELHSPSTVGFINGTLYELFGMSGYTDYIDVTTGSNGSYSALSGYDQVTGIGAPNGYAFANAI